MLVDLLDRLPAAFLGSYFPFSSFPVGFQVYGRYRMDRAAIDYGVPQKHQNRQKDLPVVRAGYCFFHLLLGDVSDSVPVVDLFPLGRA